MTGGAGFIGSHVAKRLIEQGDEVTIVDNFNEYYSPRLKEARISHLLKDLPFHLARADIADFSALEKVFAENQFEKICHLAAQAGVRYSLENPEVYERSNVAGTLNLLRLATQYKVKNFVFASTSSVYGLHTDFPLRETYQVDTPISLYAATKLAGEAMIYAYHHLYGLNAVILRFFNVFGPWGRPDSALFLFTRKILAGEPIEVFNKGNSEKDFTYIDDIVSGVVSALKKDFTYEIINLGNARPVKLMRYIELIEQAVGKRAEKKFLPLQPGDVPNSFADISKAEKLLGYKPVMSVDLGVPKFVEWYKQYEKDLHLAKY